MKRAILVAITTWVLGTPCAKAQYMQMPTIDLYDTDLMMAHLNAVREMNQRAIQIRYMVQPYREQQYQCYRDGKYREAIEICNKVYQQFVFYVHDNKGIYDMEIIAGDCAQKLEFYDYAISWYQTVKRAGIDGMDPKLSQVFNEVMEKAREAYRNNDFKALWSNVTIALETGWESGECYFYKGVCYENAGNINEKDKITYAKKMYKLAKKKKYTPAITALQNLKKKK